MLLNMDFLKISLLIQFEIEEAPIQVIPGDAFA